MNYYETKPEWFRLSGSKLAIVVQLLHFVTWGSWCRNCSNILNKKFLTSKVLRQLKQPKIREEMKNGTACKHLAGFVNTYQSVDSLLVCDLVKLVFLCLQANQILFNKLPFFTILWNVLSTVARHLIAPASGVTLKIPRDGVFVNHQNFY